MYIPIYDTIKNIKNYRYSVACLKMIYSDSTFNKLYPNMKLSPIGVLYFPMLVVGKIKKEYHGYELTNKLTVIDEALTEQNLMGIVEVKKDDMGELENGSYLYYIKVLPVVFNSMLFTVVCDLVLMVVLWKLMPNIMDIFGALNI